MQQRNVLLYGSPEEVIPPAPLRAGSLSVAFDKGDLRNIRLGGVELIRRVYVGVRDTDWGTPPAVLTDLVVQTSTDSFQISFVADHRTESGIHFRWNGDITGSSDGVIRFEMDGEALSTFRSNRIGICVHQPVEGLRGTACVVVHTDGREETGVFPELVAPHQPFVDIRAMRYGGVEIQFEGEIFELEDQRNLSDSTYKTYGTPLSLPFPVEVSAGTKVRQAVSISALPLERLSLPAIGCSLCGDLGDKQIARLKRLRLSHLRVHASELARAADQSHALEVPLEIVIGPETDLQALAAEVDRRRPLVARWLVTDSTLITAVRIAFRGAPVLAGSSGYFADLNRNRPDPSLIDGVFFPIYPQVHATDNLTVMENCASHADLIESAREFSAGKPVYATPVSIGGGRRDPREQSLFAAAWTLGSLVRLVKARAAGVTYFEATGTHGFTGSDGVFPIWHVLADIGEFLGAEAVVETGSDLAVIQLRIGDRVRTMAANLSAEPRQIQVEAGPGRRTLRVLDETTAGWAMRDPEQYRADAAQPWNGTELELLPFAVAVID